MYDKDIMTELDIRIANRRRYEEGREEGEEKKTLDLATKMKAEDLPEDLICRITGLSAEQVKAL